MADEDASVLRRALPSIGSYLGLSLAVALAGFFYKGDLPWNAVAFLLVLCTWGSIRVIFQTRVGSPGQASDTLEKALLFAVSLGMLIMPLLFIATPLLGFADIDLPAWLHGIALAIAFLGIIVFYRAHADLGRQWSVSVELQDDHQLVDSGIYAHMRHPMYSALFLITAAQAGLLDNWLAGLSGLGSFTVLYALRVAKEERLMEEAFGQAWKDYVAQTPRLVPWPGKRPL